MLCYALTYLANHSLETNRLSVAFNDAAIGHTLIVSLAYASAGVISFVSNVPISVNTLKAMLAGAGMDRKAAKIIRFVVVCNVVAVAIYGSCLVFVLTFLTIYSQSMLESPPESTVVRGMLVLRNVSIFFYFNFLGQLAMCTNRKVLAVMKQRTEASASGKASTPADVKMQLLLETLEGMSQATKKKATGVGILFGIFCLPWLHPYQVRDVKSVPLARAN
jgi:hypothetical protein